MPAPNASRPRTSPGVLSARICSSPSALTRTGLEQTSTHRVHRVRRIAGPEQARAGLHRAQCASRLPAAAGIEGEHAGQSGRSSCKSQDWQPIGPAIGRKRLKVPNSSCGGSPIDMVQDTGCLRPPQLIEQLVGRVDDDLDQVTSPTRPQRDSRHGLSSRRSCWIDCRAGHRPTHAYTQSVTRSSP